MEEEYLNQIVRQYERRKEAYRSYRESWGAVTITSRLSRLENMRPSRLMVLARMPDGTEREMSAREYTETVKDGAEMIRVLRGNDLKDLDLILSTIYFAIG